MISWPFKGLRTCKVPVEEISVVQCLCNVNGSGEGRGKTEVCSHNVNKIYQDLCAGYCTVFHVLVQASHKKNPMT